jgi:hypothetical protein
MNDNRSLIRNSVRSSDRLLAAWITSTLNKSRPSAIGSSAGGISAAADRIKRRTNALRAVRIGQRLHQVSPEYLEINRTGKGLELIAEVAQTLQALIDIEKSRLDPHHAFSPCLKGGIESKSRRNGEVFRTVQLVSVRCGGRFVFLNGLKNGHSADTSKSPAGESLAGLCISC